MKKKVIVIGSDLQVYLELEHTLQDGSIDVRHVTSNDEALQIFLKGECCIVIMDFPLLDGHTFQTIKTMRKAKPAPILLLTKRLRTEERIALLNAGATAFLEEPFDIQECIAQARSLIQLYTAASPDERRCHTLAFGMELIIDPTYWQVTLMGNQIELTRKEFDLLYCLANRAGQAVTHEQIYRQVWRNDSDINLEGTIKSHISSLRQKLSVGGKEYIENVRSVGYRFIAGGSNR